MVRSGREREGPQVIKKTKKTDKRQREGGRQGRRESGREKTAYNHLQQNHLKL